VEGHTVVEADACKPDQVGAVSGSGIRKQFEENGAVVCFEFEGVVVVVEVDIANSGVDFGFAVFAHDGPREIAVTETAEC